MDIQETVRRFNLLHTSDSEKMYVNNLREITNSNKHHFNYEILTEMRNGTFPQDDDLYDVLPAVRDLFQFDEGYQAFSRFVEALKTDAQSLQSPTNAIRKVYNGFVSKKLQHWHLINPTEYRRAISIENWEKMEIADYDYWSKKISVWKGYVKANIQQFIANSYLTSGPTLNSMEKNSEGKNLLHLLWYNLTEDKNISIGAQFYDRYWVPFTNYIQTNFDDNSATYETDAPLEGLFNLVAELEKNKTDVMKNLVTLSKIIDLVHERGSLSHIFLG